MHLPAGWDRLGINVVFIVFLPFQTDLGLCAVPQLGESILSLTQSCAFAIPKCNMLVSWQAEEWACSPCSQVPVYWRAMHKHFTLGRLSGCFLLQQSSSQLWGPVYNQSTSPWKSQSACRRAASLLFFLHSPCQWECAVLRAGDGE